MLALKWMIGASAIDQSSVSGRGGAVRGRGSVVRVTRVRKELHPLGNRRNRQLFERIYDVVLKCESCDFRERELRSSWARSSAERQLVALGGVAIRCGKAALNAGVL